LAFTTDQRDALQAAIASGVLSVTFGSRTVSYQSLEQMRETLAEIERSLGVAASTYRTYRLAATSKGV